MTQTLKNVLLTIQVVENISCIQHPWAARNQTIRCSVWLLGRSIHLYVMRRVSYSNRACVPCTASLQRCIYWMPILSNMKGNPVSQFQNHARLLKVTNSGRPLSMKLGIQMAGRDKNFQSLVFLLTQLHFGHWSSLPFCLPSLVVQWPARICHFWWLHIIVKWCGNNDYDDN